MASISCEEIPSFERQEKETFIQQSLNDALILFSEISKLKAYLNEFCYFHSDLITECLSKKTKIILGQICDKKERLKQLDRKIRSIQEELYGNSIQRKEIGEKATLTPLGMKKTWNLKKEREIDLTDENNDYEASLHTILSNQLEKDETDRTSLSLEEDSIRCKLKENYDELKKLRMELYGKDGPDYILTEEMYKCDPPEIGSNQCLSKKLRVLKLGELISENERLLSIIQGKIRNFRGEEVDRIDLLADEEGIEIKLEMYKKEIDFLRGNSYTIPSGLQY